MEDFQLGTVSLMCKWRLQNRRLPLKNRHLRALGARIVNGEKVSKQHVAWVSQYVEWTLDTGAREHPDGTFMLLVDTTNAAVIKTVDYTPLKNKALASLVQRAAKAREEASVTGVSAEDIWVVRDGVLEWGVLRDAKPCGVSSLIQDLSRTLGIRVKRSESLVSMLQHYGMGGSTEAFLTSDEHGVVVATDHSGEIGAKFFQSYQVLLEKEHNR